MSSKTLEDEIIAEVRQLDSAQQERILAFARVLTGGGSKRSALPPGVPPAALLRFAGSIPADDLREMEAAIERDCERIDPGAW